MPKSVFAALALILVTSGFVDCHAQQLPASFTIRGYIIIPSNHHIENFEVLLTNKDGDQIIDRTNVDISNHYTFANLTDGYFDVVIRLYGFQDSRTPIHVGFENKLGTVSLDSNYDANIFLTRKPGVDLEEDEERVYSKAILDEYAKGLDEITRKHPDLAVAHLEKVVKDIPDFYDGHFNLGLVYEELSKRKEAEKEFRKAQELNADSARPPLALGRLFLEEADIEIVSASKPDVVEPKLIQAREALNQAVMIDAKLATGFYYLGAVDFRSASYMNAEKELTHALELDPTLAAARITLINVYIEQKLWQPALDNVDTFLLENPASPYRQQVAATRVSVVSRLQIAR